MRLLYAFEAREGTFIGVVWSNETRSEASLCRMVGGLVSNLVGEV